MDPYRNIADGGAGDRGHGMRVFVSTGRQVFCMDPMSFDVQVDMLMGGFNVVEAFDLFRQTLLPGNSLTCNPR
jgi:hypothetical protein